MACRVFSAFKYHTWSLLHSKLKRPLLMEERKKCRPWSAIRKFRSPNQNTTLKEKDDGLFYLFTLQSSGHVHIHQFLTCGPGHEECLRCQSLAHPGCAQTHRLAAERSPYERPGGSWGSTPCDHRRKTALIQHLYCPKKKYQKVTYYFKSDRHIIFIRCKVDFVHLHIHACSWKNKKTAAL